MFNSFIRRRLGMVAVEQDKKDITIKGVSKLSLEHDVQKNWRTTVITKWMFKTSSTSEVKFSHFWALDVLYMLNVLYENVKWSRLPKRTIRTIIDKIEADTWIKATRDTERTKVDLSGLDKVATFKPMGYQKEFITHYLQVVPAFGLKGYMLDSAAGSGKTLTQLYLSHQLDPDGKKIFIVPKNSVKSVWVDTIENLWLSKDKVWDSLSSAPLTNDYKFYIFHYEQLTRAYEFVKSNQSAFSGTYVGLDESHNFNQIKSDRTQYFLDLCALDCVTNVVWASGTPISKLGSECIPFLKCIDNFFTNDVEMRFRKIYGSDAKRGLDILRHRIGHMKYHIASQDSVDVETDIIEFPIKFDGGMDYTMESITAKLREYMDERTRYYVANKKRYEDDYEKGLTIFKRSREYSKDTRAFDRYQTYIKVISRGYDPKLHVEESQYCNYYENKVIVPVLVGKDKVRFRSAKSVVKYLHLKVLGETLGLLSRYRSACFAAMIPHMQLGTLIDNAKKKTIIFTSYVDVVEKIGKQLTEEGYTPILVYGETNKNLPALVKEFYNNPDANPLIATFQSLSTAVPLTAANRVIMTNQPFRDRIKIQAIARAARKGQDMDVEVFDILLDTDGKDNISTRNQDIMEWSAEMVKAIMGTSNLDLNTLSLESISEDLDDGFNDVEWPSIQEAELVRDEPIPAYLHAISFGGDVTGNQLVVDKDKLLFDSITYQLSKVLPEAAGFGYGKLNKNMIIYMDDRTKWNLSNIIDLLDIHIQVYTIRATELSVTPIYNYDGGITHYTTDESVVDHSTSVEVIDLHSFLSNTIIRNSEEFYEEDSTE